MQSTKRFLLLLIIPLLSLPSYAQKDQEGYEVSFEVKGFPDSVAYMSYFFGAGQFYRDTAVVGKDGSFVFEDKKDSLEYGMYSVIAGNKKVFDFLVTEQRFSMKTDTSDLVGKMRSSGSKENELFFEYLRYLDDKGAEMKVYREELKKQEEGSKAYETTKAKIDKLDQEVQGFIRQIHKENPGSLTSNFIYALDYPVVPEAPKDENGQIDSNFKFVYFKEHFFDNFDFDDERLLRTSTYHEKLEYYLEKLTVQDADSVIKSVDYILTNIEDNYALFKYTLSYLTSKYERSQVMGMDAVFVHLVNQYFVKKRPDWFSDKSLKKVVEKANAIEPLLIGKKAPNIIVKDTAMKRFLQLYDVDAKYTVVYIWSPECGHCKKSTPKLKKVYDEYKDKGVEVFAVGNEYENEEWKEFIIEHDLNWINGSDGGDFKSNFRTLYDVYSTPQTYLLDENKKILSKKMSIESLEKMLEYYFKREKTEMNKKKAEDQKG